MIISNDIWVLVRIPNRATVRSPKILFFFSRKLFFVYRLPAHAASRGMPSLRRILRTLERFFWYAYIGIYSFSDFKTMKIVLAIGIFYWHFLLITHVLPVLLESHSAEARNAHYRRQSFLDFRNSHRSRSPKGDGLLCLCGEYGVWNKSYFFHLQKAARLFARCCSFCIKLLYYLQYHKIHCSHTCIQPARPLRAALCAFFSAPVRPETYSFYRSPNGFSIPFSIANFIVLYHIHSIYAGFSVGNIPTAFPDS